MKKKKLLIYGVISLTFVILFSVYTWSVLHSTDQVNEQRLNETMRTCELQIQKNLEFRAKELTYSITHNGLDQQTAFGELTSLLPTLDASSAVYYIVDYSGMMYDADNQPISGKIDSGALKAAQTNEYAAVSVPDASSSSPRIIIMVPIGPDPSFFLAQSITVEHFLDLITEDLSLPSENLALFDEWGNPISTYLDQSTQGSVQQSIYDGAVSYSYDRLRNVSLKVGALQDYNLYISVDQPRGWFIGARISYGGVTPFGLHLSTLIVLILLVLIMLFMIGLDIVNDRDKKKDWANVNNIDPLTGLLNNVGLRDALSAFIQKRPMNGFSFVCMDILAFSRINTMFGYSMGDELLRVIADDIAARQVCGTRINADCFAFLTKTSDDMLSLLESNFRAGIERRLGAEYQQMITFNFGVYPIADAKPLFREVYDGALLAHKSAKKQLSTHQVVYDAELKQTLELQKNIEINMMHALSKEEFQVYVQPQFDMPGEQCTRGETLIRWRSEFMGFLPPDKFIPIFESNGFIVETDFFMLTSALELLQSRLDAGLPPVTLAINQSRVTIAFPNYFERLKATIEQFSVPMEYIELEITESALENAWDTLVPLIHNIKKLGLSIAMDDFGSGFSSLNTLRILPIDILKIDKEFLRESDNSPRCKIIIESIVHMAKELSIRIVCEGVETKAQLEFLKEIGCDIVQGFYYSKPIPMADFTKQYLS